MIIKIGRRFGAKIERSQGSNDNWYLSAVIWYARSAKRLGYFYPSIRWF